MRLRLDPASEFPIYRQTMRQIGDAIAAGTLAPGDQLPSHREVCGLLVIASLTVKQAYDELEAEGFVESRQGSGTFVADHLPKRSRADRDARVGEAARTLLRQSYIHGLGYKEVVALLEKTRRKLAGRPPRSGPSSRRGMP